MSAPLRPCPGCSSTASELLLEVRTWELFDANWSYRPDRGGLLGDGDEAWPIHRCTVCAFVYAAKLPTPDQLTAVYEQVMDEAQARKASYERAGLASRLSYLATLMRLMPSGETVRVLDFGCGFGPTLQLLSALPSVSALGFDTSAVRVDELAARGLPATRDLARVASAAPFDAVVLDNVLEHVPDPVACLTQISSWCRSGSLLYLSVPDARLAWLHGAKQAHLNGSPWPMDLNPLEHLSYFDLAQLDRMAAGAGFRPLAQSELPEPVDIGVRPESGRGARLRNMLASLVRLGAFVARGDALASVNRRYYRFG